MTTTTTNPPSEKQVKFLESLLSEREYTEDDDEIVAVAEALAAGELDRRDASRAIDTLLARPRKKSTTSKSPLSVALERIPKSRYAVPALDLINLELDPGNNDLVFVEAREYRGTRYMRRLHGSPGGFSRSKMSVSDVMALIDIIAEDPYKYTRMFGEHYTCCGCCGAELTDARSRELMLGPECRKKFGH